MNISGKFTGLIIRRHRIVDRFEFPNGVVDIGLDRILDVMFNGGTQASNWYLGLMNQPATLSNSDTMASHVGWTENTFYNEATRPQWSPSNAGTGIIVNTTYADFTMNATANLDGIFTVDENTKGGTTGNLWATAKFIGGAKAVASADVVRVQYTVQVKR